jgi:hypothetical protein
VATMRRAILQLAILLAAPTVASADLPAPATAAAAAAELDGAGVEPADSHERAGEPRATAVPPRPLPLVDVPLLDLPFNTVDGYAAPSMPQSLGLTRSADDLARRALYDHLGQRHRHWGWWTAAAFETLFSQLPLGEGWLHEEWHRAALRRRAIRSHDGIYDFHLFSETISVDRVSDEDLVRFKRDHPTEIVRAAAAGYESTLQLALAGDEQAFVSGAQPYDVLALSLALGEAIAYVNRTAGTGGAELTDRLNAEEGADVRRRDWVGLDFSAWTYDLFRPDEPYQARGVHPSGVGINRYRKTTDLTPEEHDFLEKQGSLSFLNLLDPRLAGISRFGGRTREDWRWTASVRHQLTSFGYALDGHLFLGRGTSDARLTVHHYFNHDRFFPGLELALLRRPLRLAGHPFVLSGTAALWLQPERQRFFTRHARPGGLLAVDLELAHRGVRPYVSLVGKTSGWVAGNVYLERNLSLAAGLRVAGTRRAGFGF